jgi:restriction endonuclease S subunit
MVSEQWFVKTEEIAKKAIKVVEEEDINLFLKTGKKLILNGCTIFKIGVFQDNNGGGTGYLHGTILVKMLCRHK